MATSAGLAPMPPFDPDTALGADVSCRWKVWLEDFETFLVASDINDDKRKRALLLYQAGSRVREIFRHLDNTGEDYKSACEKLTAHFQPQKNRIFEVYTFRQAIQGSGESIDQFHTRLRSLAQNCEFHDPDFEIQMQIVIGGKSSRLRKLALRDPDFKLSDMLIAGRREESSSFQAAQIEHRIEQNSLHSEKLNKISSNKFESRPRPKHCFNCGGEYPHTSVCPAKGKTCKACGKDNHFAKYCRSKQKSFQPINPLETAPDQGQPSDSESSSDSHYCYSTEHQNPVPKSTQPKANIFIEGQRIPMTVDTGATINVIDWETFKKINSVHLEPTTVKAFAFNSSEPVKLAGKFETVLETQKRYAVATVYVTQGKGGCLLSATSAQELGLVTLHLNNISTHQPNLAIDDIPIQRLIEKHTQLFEGLGKLKGKQIELVIDENVTPVMQPLRRIPFHARKKLEDALAELIAKDIIETVPDNDKAEWVSPVVLVPKPNDTVRLCIDMRVANQAIKRTRHPIPTRQDIALSLNGATVFSKLDLNEAYHQLELSSPSRHITTFNTHIGLYRYKRLNYGTNAAAELFQHALTEVLQGLSNVQNIADDIIVYGKTRAEHDEALAACLQKLEHNGFTLNFKKCRFLKSNLKFFGQIYSKDGVQADPDKINAFLNTPTPNTVSEVRSLLGMANYCSQFIPNFATITEPLRQLTKKGTAFLWNGSHQQAYDQLKAALTNSPVMSYFDTSKDTLLYVDASPVGISAILAQRDPDTLGEHVVCYGSRALTDVEKRYSQTEKEGLAIVWGIEHFHLYLFGKSFTLFTDHRALELIYNNPTSKPPARIERWLLRLQQYQFHVTYKPGSSNPADFMSRHPVQTLSEKVNIADEYVNAITSYALPNPQYISLKELQDATNDDAHLQAVRNALKTDLWNTDLTKAFGQIRHEITDDHSSQLLLRGTRIIIPTSLQKRIVKLSHLGHPGVAKTKALLREHVWFPHMDAAVEEEVRNCLSCQSMTRGNSPEPLQSRQMPDGPWQTVHVDFFGPLPNNIYCLVFIDSYSRYPEVEFVSSTSARAVIPVFDSIFARHGLPYKIVSDNGPPFQSEELRRYMGLLDIKHEHSTPLWPQGNSDVESFMRPLKKALTIANIERRPMQQELSKFLLSYRNSPHSTTGVPPSQLLFNRKIRGSLPQLNPGAKVIHKHKLAQEANQREKEKSRTYANRRRNVKSSNINIGDTVMVKETERRKLTPKFKIIPYIVIRKDGTKITAENEHHTITRNSSFFKKIPNRKYEDIDDDDDEYKIVRNMEKNGDIVRRSTRIRMPPEHYGNPVDSSAIRF